jgi:cytochrome c-type biogenesis protein CcmE
VGLVSVKSPKELAWRLICIIGCIWGIAIAAQMALNAVARVWVFFVIAGAVALVWLVLGRRR